jgi:hypothetical protein
MKRSADIRVDRPGFTLPAILIMVAALFLLVVGLLAMSVSERRITRRGLDRERAELAARAGLAEVEAMLGKEASSDDFLVIGAKSTPHVFLVRPEVSGGDFSFHFRPLFSAKDSPSDQSALTAPDVDGADEEKISLRISGNDPVEVAWLPIEDREGKPVARYAFWVEDLQGRLDAKSAGNRKGAGDSHARPAWPFPASLNPLPSVGEKEERDAEPALDVVALHALDPDGGATDESEWDRKILDNRKLLVSPGSVLAAAEQPLPLVRGLDGRLDDPLARALEENLAATLQPYDEQPRVPFVKGIAPAVAGQPKWNLNALPGSGDEGVEKTAGWIRQALPEFESRKGGFPEQYVETLVANALDYADSDQTATVQENRYRGLDACPVISEFVMRFRWESVVQERGRKFLVLSASTYAELWNPTDQPVQGQAELSFETNFTFAAGPNPEMNLGDPAWLRDRNVTTAEPALIERDGGFAFPFNVPSLRPNEYKLIKAGQVTCKIDVGPSSIFIPSPLALTGDDAASGYKLWWNGTKVDQARGKLRRNDVTLHFPSDTKAKPRQKQRANVPALTHKRGASNYCNNPGDPRMAAYLQAPQDANDYPDNYSPNRRNVRWGNIYATDLPGKPKYYGRVLPSEWPDGGHDADYGSVPPAVLAGEGGKDGDERVMPDDAQFFQNLPEPKREQAAMMLSNRGRFYSATELGRIYDPVMWNAGVPASAGERWPDVTDAALASGDFGGGNTLRIGRPEHPRFDRPAMRATRLLDLFHAGKSRSEDPAQREGPLVRIEGHVNLNTARRDVIRALAAGSLTMDPLLAKRTSLTHDMVGRLAAPVSPLELSAPTQEREADRIADAILKGRPFASPSEIAALKDEKGRFVFGNRDVYSEGSSIQWSDAAAEEVFARVFEASTVRSRNFRVWVIGQSLGPTKPDGSPEVLAECRKVFSVFADPGERKTEGAIDPTKTRAVILDENDF